MPGTALCIYYLVNLHNNSVGKYYYPPIAGGKLKLGKEKQPAQVTELVGADLDQVSLTLERMLLTETLERSQIHTLPFIPHLATLHLHCDNSLNNCWTNFLT